LFSQGGLGKKFEMTDLPLQKRAGKGLMCYKGSEVTGPVTAATLVSDEDNVLIIGDKTSICIEATEIPSLGRASMGNQLIKNSKIVSVSKV
jgi:DNA gyrase subunit A